MPTKTEKANTIELLTLHALQTKKNGDQQLNCDDGMLRSELHRSVFKNGGPFWISKDAILQAITALVTNGEVSVDKSGRHPVYRILKDGCQRLAAIRPALTSESVSNPENIDTISGQNDRRPPDDDPSSILWLARQYANSLFPPIPRNR